MSLKTGAQAIADARIEAGDQDPTGTGLNLGIPDTDAISLLNKHYQSWFAAFDLGVVAFPGTLYTTAAAKNTLSQVVFGGAGTIKKLLRAVFSGGGFLVMPERIDLGVMLDMQNRSSPAATNSGPKYWSYQKYVDSNNTYDLFWYPASAAGSGSWTVTVHGEMYPADIQLGNTINLADAEARWLTLLLAADMASILGRAPERIQQILMPIPDDIKVKLGMNVQQVGVNRSIKQEAV